MGRRDLLFFAVVVGGAAALGAGLRRPADRRMAAPGITAGPRATVVAEADAAFRRAWSEKKITPVARASDLAVMRRLGLALTGSIPSLEEIRRFEARPETGRIDAWLEDLLGDRRCADYLAERFARAFVGTEDGPFLRFRRRRFASWLSDEIAANRPYDSVVRELVAGRGLWTDHPATNFVSVTFDPGPELPDPERLAARTARAFLGVRLDCAQCHDHPFQPWKQDDFRGLAAFYGGVTAGLRGIQDGGDAYRPADRKTKAAVEIRPRVPFLPEACPDSGTSRERLAAWIVDPQNPQFARATTNRMWALLFGRPLAEPIDDLPPEAELPPALALIAADFSGHGHDLRRLIRTIAALEVFRLDSASPDGDATTDDQQEAWAAFPLTRLRPEQVAGALFQSASIPTLDARSHWFFRLINLTQGNDFVHRYGDAGDDEFDHRGGTILQRLLLMNGDLVREKTKDDFSNAGSRIATLAPDDHAAVEAAYLVVLTRRPSREETDHFAARLAGTAGEARKERLADLCWTLLNATEFSWNH